MRLMPYMISKLRPTINNREELRTVQRFLTSRSRADSTHVVNVSTPHTSPVHSTPPEA